MASTIDPSVMSQALTSDYVSAVTPEPGSPTESSFDDDGSSLGPEDENGKRKRKSWGQAIPEYEKILPPGKRAKTDAEKEQRRCERIMRNRRAAATSRDRKKREFEDMEKKVQERDNELAWVRSQAQAQMEKILAVAFPDGNVPATLASLDLSFSRASSLPPTPAYSPIEEKVEPRMMRHSSPAMSVLSLSNNNNNNNNNHNKTTSQTLTPALFIKHEEPELESIYSHNTPPSLDEIPDLSHNDHKLDDLVNSAISNPSPFLDVFANIDHSGMTQYPAEVLCIDQQCLPESSKAASRSINNKWVNSILVIQLMVASAMSSFSSAKMTWLMSQVLTSLERIWPQALTSTHVMDMIFPLIHSLIFLPSKETTSRRTFRMAFLRKLLSCSPASARHFDDATSRALRRLASAEAIQESHRGGISWASLVTLRWAIWKIEQESEHHRKRFKLAIASSLSSSSSIPTTSGTGSVVGDRSSGMAAYNGSASIGSYHGPSTDRGACTPGHVH